MYETELSHDRKQDPALRHYLTTIGRFSLLTRKQEHDLARRVRGGDQEALADESAPHPPRQLEESTLAHHLEKALGELDACERNILERYYGLGPGPTLSLEAIGEIVGLSRERVRQIRNRAFAKLRQGAGGGILAEFMS